MSGPLKTIKYHFIGIGGIGMSGIAEVLLDLGYKVSGSDLNTSPVTDNLAKKGAVIHKGHAAAHVEGVDRVVYSSAIDPKNSEFQRAKELNLPLIRRGEMLAELMKMKSGIAIAGSHGKTTTTSLVATIFQEANLDATYIIGGIVSNLGGNSRMGQGKFLIAEADESDGSFLQLNPVMAAVTNIDDDHLDHYGTKEKIVDAFVEFVNNLPNYGKAVLNANDMVSKSIRERVKRPLVWYGINTDADFSASEITYSAKGTVFEISHNGRSVGKVETHLIGAHNVSNTLAAIAISHEAGIEWKVILSGLLKFKGVGRRLEKIFEKDDFIVIDDYGHHPTEVSATIKALKGVDHRKLTVVFEPHRFTRTQNFWKEFQECFTGADELYISPIYAASENPILGITSEKLVEEMKAKGINASFIFSLDEMKRLLEERKSRQGIFLTLGAGAISKKAREQVKSL
jgi:UDP-N-acetylmuramate--alanine ligase